MERNYKKEYEGLISLLDKMRGHQKHYFKHKDNQSLGWAKDYEKRIDIIIKWSNNPKLF